MFKPARMTRILLGGHQSRMEEVIEVLHKEKAVHLEDYADPTGTTGIGTPLEAGDRASDLLVRTRGLLRALDAEETPSRELTTQDPEAILREAEDELGPVVAEAAHLRQDRAQLEAEAQHLRPFASIDAPLEILTSMASIQGYMGTVRDDPLPALEAAGIESEAGIDGHALIVAVPRDQAEATDRILSEHGYAATAIPEGANGTPAQRLAEIDGEAERHGERLERAEQRLAGHREQWVPRLAALERHLAQRVDKTQAPLRFAVTETTFHAEGWIPAERANRVRNAISAKFGDNIYFEDLGDAPRNDATESTGAHELHGDNDHHATPDDEAPVKLRNRGLARPYEFLLTLLGRPRYNEIDPTKLMLIFFPLFFGLMVGDVLVGLIIMAFGLFLRKNKVFGIGGPAVGRTLAMGGFVAAIVGLLVFGEALGMHFVVSEEALEDGEVSWEAMIYGKDAVLHGDAGFPEEGFLHRSSHAPHGEILDNGTNATAHAAVADTSHSDPSGDGANATLADGTGTEGTGGGLAPHAEETEEAGGIAAMLAPHGGPHLKAGPVQLGHYSKIHDIQALLIWSVLIGIVHIVLGFLLGVRNVYVSHGATLAIQEKASWLGIMASVPLIIVGLGDTIYLAAGVGLFVVSLALLWMGVQHTLGAGFISLLEIPGLAGNLLSYTRLAAIGASKAGMVLAFLAIGFDVVGGGDLHSIAGWIVYLLGMTLITALAMLSGGLQSLRLQFVEFFQKFYEGGGRPYVPFGRRGA